MTTLYPDHPTALTDHHRGVSSVGYPDPSVKGRLITVWRYRNLVRNLSRREIRSRHKNSVLGVAWNLFTPLLQMTIYSLVFSYFMPRGAPAFPLKLLTGMAIYGLFGDSLQAATTSVVGNASLVTKIWFPREILPITSIIANLVTFASRLLILGGAYLAYRHPPDWSMVWLTVPAIIIAVMLATGVGMLLAAANVFFRDVQHFLSLALLALFWFTPVVWDYSYLADRVVTTLGPQWERLIMVNPLIPLVITFQRALYNPAAFEGGTERFRYLFRPTSWYLENLAISFLIASILLYVGLRVFAKLEGAFAENL